MKKEVYRIEITMPDNDKIGAEWLQGLLQDTLDSLDADGRFAGRYTVKVDG